MLAQQDVVIVGAGPGGSFLAYLLARSGVKVTLVERHSSFDREFRGPVFQASVVKLLDEANLLKPILKLPYERQDAFTIFEGKDPLFHLDLGILPGPYNWAFSTEHGPFLKTLIKKAAQFPSFTYLSGCLVEGLIYREGVVRGVIGKSQQHSFPIHARLVVAFDGRCSTVRQDACIELKKNKQALDVLWFRLPSQASFLEKGLNFSASHRGLMVSIPREHGETQFDWILPRGSWGEIKSRGFEALQGEILKARPDLRTSFTKNIQSFSDIEFLEIQIAQAKEWTRDGLLLLGDAAHTSSPIGAQGNKLAMEDAALAHPIIFEALKREEGSLPASTFKDFIQGRQRDVEMVLNLQERLAWLLSQPRDSIRGKIRGWLGPFLQKSSFGKKVTRALAMGEKPVSVASYHFLPDRDKSFHVLEVKEIIREAPGTCSYVFDVPAELHEYYQALAGQFITLKILFRGQYVRRCFSLSSLDPLKITIKAIPKGLLSNYILENIQIGDRLLVAPPAGHFTLPDHAKKACFFAAGSGIVPIFSLLSAFLKDESRGPARLLYVCRQEHEIIFWQQIEDLQREYGERFAVDLFLTQASEGWEGYKGRPTPRAINEFLERCSFDPEYHSFLCGPENFMAAVKRTLLRKEAKKDFIHREAFASLPPDSPLELLMEQPQLEVGDPDAEEAEPQEFILHWKGEEHRLKIHSGESILDAAMRQGLSLPFSCKEGVCSSCKATLLEGRVKMLQHDALGPEEAAEGCILTCQAKACTAAIKVYHP